VPVRGTKKDAQRELTRRLAEIANGTAVNPSTLTIGEYLRNWLDTTTGLSPKTLERYRQLSERQIIPHLGSVVLQQLRPAQVDAWHKALLNTGLSARTVGHAHRVLHRGLERAVGLEMVGRNVAHVVSPPRVKADEIAILTADQMTETLDKLIGHPLHPIAALALASGMRRGELCGLAWGDVDFDKLTVRVERSLEETTAGLRLKQPKTRYGYRSIAVPKATMDVLREHHRHQLEQRLVLGLGRPGADDLVFTLPDASPYPPDKLSRDWGNVVRYRKLPRIMFHGLRHSHASALLAASVDIVTVSRRLWHSSPAVTLRIYAHVFTPGIDTIAAHAIDAVLGAKATE